jgi:cell division protein FtsL
VARTAAASRPAPRVDDAPRVVRPRPAGARRTTTELAVHARAVRWFFVFVVCFAVLAVGRVALSFAVVQKSLQTDTVQTQARAVEAANADLQAEVTRLGSSARIRTIAQSQLGLVQADRPIYLTVEAKPPLTQGGSGR